MSTTNQTDVATRIITVISTRGEKRKIPFTGTTWKELKDLLTRGGKDINGDNFQAYSLSNMKAVETHNNTTLEHPKAIVPVVDFHLFLMAYRSKSGGEVRDKVKGLFASNKESAKAHFGNYTQKKEEELERLLKTYKGSTGAKTPSSTKPAKAAKEIKPTKAIKSVSKTKEATAAKEIKEEEEVTNVEVIGKLVNYDSILDSAMSLSDNEKRLLASKLTESLNKAVSKSSPNIDEDKVIERERDELYAGFDDIKKY